MLTMSKRVPSAVHTGSSHVVRERAQQWKGSDPWEPAWVALRYPPPSDAHSYVKEEVEGRVVVGGGGGG